MIKKISIIGAGQMGLGIGIDFVRFGYDVCLYDTKEGYEKSALETAYNDLNLMAEMELISTNDAKDSYNRLSAYNNLEETTSGADYIVEAVYESLDLKRELFARLDKLCDPSTILASNTTTLRITDIASEAKYPERILTTHYFQPPHFIPLVEIVGGEKTSQRTIDAVKQLLNGIRKKVVILNKDVNGLIGARLQTALSREVENIVNEGLSDNFEDIDSILTMAFGRRLSYLANFKRLDYMGLDFLYNMLKKANFPIWEPIADHVEKGEFGMKSGKGFYDWPDDSAEQEILHLKKGLIRLMMQDMEEGKI